MKLGLVPLAAVLGAVALLLAAAACDAPSRPATTASRPAPAADPPRPSGQPVSAATLFADVAAEARRLAETPYRSPEVALPPALAALDYDAYRAIRFRPEAALWRGAARFELQLFHPGFIHREPVRLHLVEGGRIAPLAFDGALFRYDGPAAPAAGAGHAGLGYAGFRVHYPLNDPAIKDEVVVFLGASYFRLLGRGHVYGLSSRGLAVDTALESGEEFPVFREFWLQRPAPEAATLTFWALLDSRSVSGAYRFDLTPGAHTTLRVDARLFARTDVAKLGVAPLSSMFLYGPGRPSGFDDFRARVHDSDGLLVRSAAGEADEWIWRPLRNGPDVQVTTFPGPPPRGFGLLQRARRFADYLDAEAAYHRRPSAWIEPLDGDWAAGRVELLEFAVPSEFHDNVAAYWVPDEPLAAAGERRYRYDVTMFDARLPAQTLATVERTRNGWDALPGAHDPPPRSQRRFVVDFAGVPADAQAPIGVLETSSGEVSDLVVHPLPDGEGWRASFRLAPAGREPAELRLYLARGDRRLSETWSHVWHPDAAGR